MDEVRLLENAILTISAALLSGLIGVLIGTLFSLQAEVRREKIEILKTLVTYILVPNQSERVAALNLIPVVFHKDKNICEALEEYKRAQGEATNSLNTQNFSQKLSSQNDFYIKLIELIAKKLRYNSALTWDKLKNPYSPHYYIGSDSNYYWY